MRGQKQSSVEKKDVVSDDAEKNVSKKAAAAHTYDYFRDKWDKFDVVNIGLLSLLETVIWLQPCQIFQCVRV